LEEVELSVRPGSSGTDMGGAGSEDCLKINLYAPVGANRDSNRKSSRELPIAA